MLICPQCGNTELYLETGGIMGDIYRCKKCTYIGNFVIVGEENMAEEIEESHHVETGRL
ncbi:MAG: hypothetical protein FWE78_02920 [Methanimicrococcus sp.]|nr:hypothetical protein [Methanimicrococcus sp.]